MLKILINNNIIENRLNKYAIIINIYFSNYNDIYCLFMISLNICFIYN